MSKKKLKHFAQMKAFENVIEPKVEEIIDKDHFLKGNWGSKHFQNNNPIVLELGCGKGEYSVGLASKYPDKNFIGIDIKGSRIWNGSNAAINKGIKNVAFIRAKIEFISSFFSVDEVSEIWITFPDPQLKRSKKRLSSARYLNLYKSITCKDSVIHLKTDSKELHDFTLDLIELNKLDTIAATNNLYSNENQDLLSNSNIDDLLFDIKTFYELKFIDEGKKITYIQFKLNNISEIVNPIN